MPNQTPRPVQFPVLRKEQFATDEGVAYFNLAMSQIVNAINQNNGQAGAVVLPSGVDVQGSSVTGLGAPSDPTDAVSLGHSNTNYGAPAVAPQLDIGGKNTLKGLAYCYQQVKKLNAAPGTTSGSNSNGAWVIDAQGNITQRGVIADLGSGDYDVTFPIPFTTTANLSVVATCVYPSGSGVYVVINEGSITTTGFSLHQAELTNLGANWIAMGT